MTDEQEPQENVEAVKVELLIENEGRLLFDCDETWAERGGGRKAAAGETARTKRAGEVDPVKVELLIENEGRWLFDYDDKCAERQRTNKKERGWTEPASSGSYPSIRFDTSFTHPHRIFRAQRSNAWL